MHSSERRSRKDAASALSRQRPELDYRLTKEMWAFTGNRIAVRFAYEWHDDYPCANSPKDESCDS